jgi:uncharacterized membrane protein
MIRSGTSLELGISWILRAGVAASLGLESLGLFLNYLYTGDSSLSLSTTWLARGGNFFGFASSLLGSLASGVTPVSVTGLGVIVLVLTPYFRVLASVIYYTVQRDWRYVAITLTVLVVITFGLALF